ncbi:hypothetical protein BR93DRAFT_923143, partial [Coniochaeta sp. PMI_546]
MLSPSPGWLVYDMESVTTNAVLYIFNPKTRNPARSSRWRSSSLRRDFLPPVVILRNRWEGSQAGLVTRLGYVKMVVILYASGASMTASSICCILCVLLRSGSVRRSNRSQLSKQWV